MRLKIRFYFSLVMPLITTTAASRNKYKPINIQINLISISITLLLKDTFRVAIDDDFIFSNYKNLFYFYMISDALSSFFYITFGY